MAVKDFSILIILIGVLTLVFRYTKLDITLEHYFYSPQKGWMLQYQPFWDFIYRYGIFPGYILAFLGLILISLSYWNSKYIKFRKVSFLLVFTIIVGPGILVNLVLKDHTGRPRPREITEFGGTETYLCVCEIAKTNEGKSFPCGHCSMGFYLAIPYLFYRGRKKFIARSFLITGLLYGILIGIARMMAGGHFASDVVWAGGITWGVALAGYYLFSLGKPIKTEVLSGENQKKIAKRVTLISGILLPVITLGLMLATPYFSKKYLDVTKLQLKTIRCKVVDLDLRDATVTISAGKDFHLDYNVNAFGFPNSKIRAKWILSDTSRYVLQYMGWFTEVKNNVNLQIPLDDSLNWMIHVGHGKVICNLPKRFTAFLLFSIQKGDLMIRSPSDSLKLIGNEAIVVSKKSGNPGYYMQNRFENSRNTISFDVHDGKVFIE